MEDLTGQTLGDYHVYRRLGRGAMADVYLAEQQSLKRRVALKVLSAELARDDTYVARFQHEARAAAALVHGNIVQIYEVGVVDGHHFIAQEYVAGANLGEFVQQHGRLAPGLVLDLLRQVTAALCRAEEAAIVHRDIKPENLMLASTGELKVADFGLARAGTTNLTQVGVTMGTPLYMSPEQVEGRSVDSRSDLYSLGVTAYHLLVGAPPFVGDTPMAVAVQHLNTTAPELLEQRPDTPHVLAEIVNRLMAKNADQRPTGPAQLAAELLTLATQAIDEGWAMAPNSTSPLGTLPHCQPILPATAELSQLMLAVVEQKRSADSAPKRWRAPAIIACLLVGAIVGWTTRSGPLLSATPPGPAEKETALQQVFHAKLLNTEEAWQIVAERFPQADPLYLNQAKQGLARLYLNRGDYDAARPLCAQLAALDNQPTIQLFGQVGGIICDVARGNYRRAERALSSGTLIESLPQLVETDPELHSQLQSARKRLGATAAGG